MENEIKELKEEIANLKQGIEIQDLILEGHSAEIEELKTLLEVQGYTVSGNCRFIRTDPDAIIEVPVLEE